MRTFVYSCALAAAMLPSTSAFAAFAPSACRLPVHASQGRSLQVSHAPRSARVGAIALRAAEDDVIRTEAEAPVSPAKAEDGSAAFFEKEFSMDSLEGVGVKDPEVADKALLEKEFEADSALGKDPTPPSPGQLDNSRFRCDASVQKWADFDNFASAEDNFSAAAAIPAKYIGTSPQAAQYWAGHMARTAYFAANALAGTTAFQLSQQASGSEGQPDINGTPWASPNGLGVDMKIASRLVLEAMMCYEQDWLAVERGDIKMAWDMAQPDHRQHNPFNALRQSARFVEEAVGTLGRRVNNGPKGVWLGRGKMGYPAYYMNNFHYQGDGWMSTKSANVYETSTETLFLGRQDSMQRQTLLGLAGTTPSKVLEVACGTGRFGTFLRDNHPQAEYTAVDLSPFYLQKARDNDAYWVSRQPGPNKPAPAKFVQAAAEALPFEDGAFDAVVNVYLFHEMPAKARREAVNEMARVLAPGGTLSWTDSFQRGDRPALDESMSNFGELNEPHYVDYIQTDVGKLFEEAGLKPQGKWMSSTSKTLSFTKPLSS